MRGWARSPHQGSSLPLLCCPVDSAACPKGTVSPHLAGTVCNVWTYCHSRVTEKVDFFQTSEEGDFFCFGVYNLCTVFQGVIRRNSLGGSSSGSQDKPGKGVTFATDISRMVSSLLIETLCKAQVNCSSFPVLPLLPCFSSEKPSQSRCISGLPHLKCDCKRSKLSRRMALTLPLAHPICKLLLFVSSH